MADTETLSIRAEAPGRLPSVAPTKLLGIQLPLGVIVNADPEFSTEPAHATQRAWMSAGELDHPTDLWWQLARAFPRTGLWPLVAHSLDDPRARQRPWSDGELSDPTEPQRSVEEFFTATLAGHEEVDLDGEWRYPAGFPGLAERLRGDAERVTLPRVELPAGGILLVPTTRPADVLSRLGWLGATNVHQSGDLTTVLRSWEDRFGTVPVVLGFDTLATLSEATPASGEQLDRIVAEHYAFCPDNIDQGIDDLAEYGSEIAGKAIWNFWWD